MSEMKHTPGPWEAIAEIGSDNFAQSIYGPAGDYDALLIARVSQNGSHDADARLIAAAPDILEALSAMVAEYDAWAGYNDDGFESKTIAAARGAIAKAERGKMVGVTGIEPVTDRV